MTGVLSMQSRESDEKGGLVVTMLCDIEDLMVFSGERSGGYLKLYHRSPRNQRHR